MYYRNKKHWLSVDPFNLESIELAIFYTGENTDEKEKLVVFKVVSGKVETRELKIE